MGTLKLFVRFLVESGAKKDQCTIDDGSTPLHVAAQKGHLEVVRFLAWLSPVPTKDQGTTDDGTTLFLCSSEMATVNSKLSNL